MKARNILLRSLACVCVLSMIVLSACSGGGAGNSAPAGSAGGGEKEVSSESAGDQADITLRMAWWGGEARHEATLAALKIFEEKNTGIKVVPEYQGYDGYADKVITQLAGGTAPDVFQFSPGDVPLIADYAVNLSDYVGKELDLSDVPESNLADGTYNGKIQSIPLSMQTCCLFLNKTMFDKTGVSIPGNNWTWDDYYALVSELKDKLPAGIYPSNDLRADIDFTILYVHQQGGALLTPGGEIKFAQYAGPFYEKFQKMMEDGLVPPMEESVTGPDELFTEGRAAITSNYNAMADGMASEMVNEDEVVLVAIPGSQDEKKLGMWVNGEIGLVANAKSSYVSESVRLINAFVNDEDMYQELKLTRGVPTSSRILDILSKDMSPLEKQILEMQMLALESKDIPEPKSVKGWGTRWDVIEPEVQAYAFGNQTLEETLANIESKFAKELRDAA